MTRPDQTPTQPRMYPTRPATLCVAALAAAAVAWLGISNFYGDIPPLTWLPGGTLFGLGLVEAVTATSTKARIDRKKGTVPINPLVVARYVVLAKASALAGALFVGLYAGILVWLVTERGRTTAIDKDLPQAVAGLIGGCALMGAALWLERACRVPAPPPNGGAGQPGPNDRTPDGRQDGDRSGGA
jgi:hypothetical protein